MAKDKKIDNAVNKVVMQSGYSKLQISRITDIPYSTLITGHKNGDTLVGDSGSIFYVCKNVATNKLCDEELRSRAFDLCWHLGALKFNTTVQSQDLIKYLKS